ncbi:MAG: hypothetical protein QOH67_5084, partial [Hyphomicrobiales bacterium]|nr:hypothetical protein [Hyphomicrobiales bacterium]
MPNSAADGFVSPTISAAVWQSKPAARKKDAGGNGNHRHSTDIAGHRKLIAHKYDGSARRGPGGPAIGKEIVELVVRMATEKRSWGYLRIQGALSNPGHELAHGTIANILTRNAIEPAPERLRKTTGKEFLAQHREQIVATDFFTEEVWTRQGLRRFMILFFIEM